MKTRNGFVSNSSSSSFVVAFRELPKDVRELEQMLFNDFRGEVCDAWFNHSATTAELTWQIWEDMQRKLEAGAVNPNDEQLLREFMHSLGYDEVRMILDAEFGENFCSFCPETPEEDLKNYEDLREDLHGMFAEKALKDFRQWCCEETTVFVFEYGDSHGDCQGRVGTVLETGDVFRNICPRSPRLNNH